VVIVSDLRNPRVHNIFEATKLWEVTGGGRTRGPIRLITTTARKAVGEYF
jgi:hypothetical protein